MLKCAIVDDETSAINILKEFIGEIPDLTLVMYSTNSIEALLYLQKEPVDILFLDVNMPKLSGLDLVRLIQKLPQVPYFILTTAYSKYAIEGYEHDVLDYLLKPISFDRFLKAVQKVNAQTIQKKVEDKKTYFFVNVDTKNKTVKINFDDIQYIEGLKNFVSIHTKNERIIAMLNLKDLENILPVEKFQRIHKSFIIPIETIKSLQGNQIYLNGVSATIPLGPTYRTPFVEFLKRNSIK
jgi:DNA-binding LytR/AlgR family response regulator